jgi:predicted nucleic acid-binding protein
VRSLPVSLISELDDEIFYKAGYFKATYHISFADSILLGTAKRFNATVVTADHHELNSVEATGELDFLWIR